MSWIIDEFGIERWSNGAWGITISPSVIGNPISIDCQGGSDVDIDTEGEISVYTESAWDTARIPIVVMRAIIEAYDRVQSRNAHRV
jgi:hypothetical protein